MSRRRRVVLAASLAAAVAVAAGATGLALLDEDRPAGLPAPLDLRDEGETSARPLQFDPSGFEPFAFEEQDEEELLERGRDAFSHVLYEKSPGGVEATADRVEELEPEIGEAAERHGVDPETLGALVFLESGGRPEVMADGTPDSATGLGQILPGTATDLLEMSVELGRSRRLTVQIDRAERKARRSRTAEGRELFEARAERLRAARRRADERFDPRASLDGAARYLALAEQRFGREDLAIASYHMGIGNLESVIEAYGGGGRPSYVRLYYDSSPTEHPAAYRRLLAFGDDSRHYLFRLEAAREIRRLHEEDPDELERLTGLQTAKASAEEVLRPEEEHPPYEDAEDLREAYAEGELVPLPEGPEVLGYRIDPKMGVLAPRVEQPRRLYRGLRPAALATLLFIAKETREVAGERHPGKSGGRGDPGGGRRDPARGRRPTTLRVTSTVRDIPYQRLLIDRTDQATREFSLHTTGFALDIARDFSSSRQERALVHVLERLRALRVIDWVYEPGAIHLTAGPDADSMLPLLERLREAAEK